MTKKNSLFDGPPPAYEAIVLKTTDPKSDEDTNTKQVNDEEDTNNLESDVIESAENNVISDYDDNLEPDYDLIVQQDDYIKHEIKNNYPLKYIIADCVLMAMLNIALIGLQIYAVCNNAALSYLGSAIWAGLYNLGAVAMVVLTIKYRNPTLMMATTVVKLFGMIISFCGFILVHMVAFYHYNCLAASYFRPCYNKDIKNVHYAIIILGIPCLISSLGFFIYFQIRLVGRFAILNKAYRSDD